MRANVRRDLRPEKNVYIPDHDDKVKVKCTLVQALGLCTDCTAHRGSRGIALLFLDHGTRRGWGVSITPWPLFTPGKDSVPIVQEACWAPGPVWTGAKNLAPHRDSIPGTVQPVVSCYTDYDTRPHDYDGDGDVFSSKYTVCVCVHHLTLGNRFHFKCDGKQLRTGGEVKGKQVNGVGSQYSATLPLHFQAVMINVLAKDNTIAARWSAHLDCQ